MRYLIMAGVAAMLVGCLGIEDTLEESKKVNQHLSESQEAARIQFHYKVMTDANDSATNRVRSTQFLLLHAPDNALGAWFGMQLDYREPLIRRMVRGTEVVLPNVAFVGDAAEVSLGLAPLRQDVVTIQKTAILQLLSKINTEAKQAGGMTAQMSNENHKWMARLIYIAPAVFGGMSVEALKAKLAGESVAAPAEETQLKNAVASLLLSAAVQLSLSEDQLRVLKENVKRSLGETL